MSLFQLKYAKNVLLHLLFWVAVWFFFVYFFSYNSADTRYISWFASFLLPLCVFTSYFFVYFLIPRYLFGKKYFLFALYTFYTLVVSTYLIVLTMIFSYVFLANFEIALMPPMSKNYVFILILIYLVVAIVSLVSLLENNFKTLSRNKELENKILAVQLKSKEQELNYLKRQIHPHFLFNTLNTIYGFALKKSDKTQELILKLSNLLDYILYEANKPLVSLKNEIIHIKEYLELEKMRFRDTLKIDFQATDLNEDVKIPPMLFIPFVENAFKHGSIVNEYLSLKIKLEYRENTLNFYVSNSIKNEENKKTKEGIGLQNIKKRLEMYFADDYSLNSKIIENKYIVELEIHIKQ